MSLVAQVNLAFLVMNVSTGCTPIGTRSEEGNPSPSCVCESDDDCRPS